VLYKSLERNYLIFEPPFFLRPFGSLERHGCVFILLGPCDVEILCNILVGPSHRLSTIIRRTVILDFLAQSRSLIGELRHGLDANCQTDVDLTRGDLICDCCHRHKARRTKPVDRLDRDRMGDSSDKRGGSCSISSLRIQHGANTDIPKEGRVKVYPRKCLLKDGCLRRVGGTELSGKLTLIISVMSSSDLEVPELGHLTLPKHRTHVPCILVSSLPCLTEGGTNGQRDDDIVLILA
jgi:hypothetical protein